MSDVATRARPGPRLRGLSAPLLLLVGVVLIPLCLTLLSTSWEMPDNAAYVRMAFASVAGSTVAIITVVGLLVSQIVRRASVLSVAISGFIAVVVISWQVNSIGVAAALLLQRLDLPV